LPAGIAAAVTNSEKTEQRAFSVWQDRVEESLGGFRLPDEDPEPSLLSQRGVFAEQGLADFQCLGVAAILLVMAGEHSERVERMLAAGARNFQEGQQHACIVEPAVGHPLCRHSNPSGRQVRLKPQTGLVKRSGGVGSRDLVKVGSKTLEQRQVVRKPGNRLSAHGGGALRVVKCEQRYVRRERGFG
jgi:hypothetical protein